MIFGAFNSGKTNVLLSLIKNEPDIEKMSLYARDLYKAKYQKLLLNNQMIRRYLWYLFNDIYENIEYHNLNRKRKILIVFYDMTADIPNNKNFNSIVTKVFIRGQKLSIFLVFITQYYLAVPKIVRLNLC